jgi:hypothetical protein
VEAIRNTVNGDQVVSLTGVEADSLMAALASNSSCPEMDDLLETMRNARPIFMVKAETTPLDLT